MTRQLFRFCTAALAGSIIGITYDRFAPIKNWPLSGTRPAEAYSSSIVPKNPQNPDLPAEYYSLPDVNVKVSGDNFRNSAKYGLPSKDNIRLFNDFVISYDRRLRAPAWVLEHLTAEKLQDNTKVTRNKSRFLEDHAIHEYFRAKNVDFLNSGYDRGHMAAAANHKMNQEDMDQTFAFSNVSPQVPEFNRGAWERLERYVRFLAKRSLNLYVVTGPLYLPIKANDGNLYVTYRVLGNNHISVPSHYFKVILYEGKDNRMSLEAFVMPNLPSMNDTAKLNDYRCPINQLDAIERASGVIFFDTLVRDKVDQPINLFQGFKDEKYVNRRIASPA